MKTLTPLLKDLVKRSGSMNIQESQAALQDMAVAITGPLRQGIMDSDILGSIYEPTQFEPGAVIEYPLDFVKPGTEDDFRAYTMPNCGFIPHFEVQGDYVTVPTYYTAASIDWCLQYARDARWDIVSRASGVLRDKFVKKMNDDGWHTILGAGFDRNIVVYDSAAAPGQLTKKLISLMKVVMRRNGGGNSTSMNRGKLTDVYLSPEALEDVRNWGVDQVDEITRREIFVQEGDHALLRIFGVNLHPLDELGDGQEYQTFYEVQLAGGAGLGLPAGDIEIVVGLDLSNRDSFVHPIREPVQIFPDERLRRSMKAGFFGWQRSGFAVLDSRRVLLGSI